MDISDTLAPNSDQLDAIDLLVGPRTFTVERVSKGNSEQPVQIHLVEFPRPWRPGKTMRRVLAACWGTESQEWIGRRVRLYCDESVRFGSEVVGGTRIVSLSHIEQTKHLSLPVSRGKSARYKVEPLPDDAPAGSPAVSAETLAELKAKLIRKGVPQSDWLPGVNYYTRGAATDLEVITEEQARLVLGKLDDRPDVEQQATASTDAVEGGGPSEEDIAAMNAEANAQSAEFEASQQGDGGLWGDQS